MTGEKQCEVPPDSAGDISAAKLGDQGQRAEGGAGSQPRQGRPAGFSACMLPSCGDPVEKSGAVGHPQAPPGTLSRPGSLRPQATGLTAPRWPWQSGRLVCCTPEAPEWEPGEGRCGRFNGQTYPRGLSEETGSVCGGCTRPRGGTQTIPALSLLAWQPVVSSVILERCCPQQTLGHPSPRPLPAASSLVGAEESEHSCWPTLSAVYMPLLLSTPPMPRSPAQRCPSLCIRAAVASLKQHLVKTMVAGPAGVCGT